MNSPCRVKQMILWDWQKTEMFQSLFPDVNTKADWMNCQQVCLGRMQVAAEKLQTQVTHSVHISSENVKINDVRYSMYCFIKKKKTLMLRHMVELLQIKELCDESKNFKKKEWAGVTFWDQQVSAYMKKKPQWDQKEGNIMDQIKMVSRILLIWQRLEIAIEVNLELTKEIFSRNWM